jgi:ABC-2 type transport system permease protein
MAFYFEQSQAFLHIKWMLDATLGGYMIPLVLYPDFLEKIISFLPFKFIYFIPASIYLNTLSRSQVIFDLTLGYSWVIILYLISHNFWKRGIAKYSSVGG